MAIDRVNYGDTRVYVNDTILKGVSSCEISTTREVENVRQSKHYETTDRILKSKQTPEATISWNLGEESSDPFFDFQNSGVVSVESFDIKKRDIAGTQIVSGAFLTSYSVNAAVGALVTAEAQYEGNGVSSTPSGALVPQVQTSDSYAAFLPSKIELSATFQEGDIFHLPVQSFSINVPISRTPFGKLGDMVAPYRIPTLPVEATTTFSVVKTQVTGIDFSKILLEKGDFEYVLKTCGDVGKSYSLKNCSLLGISESLDLDGNASIDFNYVAGVTGDSFFLTSDVEGLLDSNGELLLSSDGFSLIPL